MKNAILVPGRPDRDEYYDPSQPTNSNNHWFPWLSKQLMMQDIFTVSLEIPEPWRPRYNVWKRELERFDITPETMLVGHSCGGGFLIRYLSENKELRVSKVVLVAPWINPDNNLESDTADFFDFEIDSELVGRTKGVTIFYSDDDHPSILQTVEIVREKVIELGYREFHNYGHFCYKDLKTDKFPELLEEVTT